MMFRVTKFFFLLCASIKIMTLIFCIFFDNSKDLFARGRTRTMQFKNARISDYIKASFISVFLWGHYDKTEGNQLLLRSLLSDIQRQRESDYILQKKG